MNTWGDTVHMLLECGETLPFVTEAIWLIGNLWCHLPTSFECDNKVWALTHTHTLVRDKSSAPAMCQCSLFPKQCNKWQCPVLTTDRQSDQLSISLFPSSLRAMFVSTGDSCQRWSRPLAAVALWQVGCPPTDGKRQHNSLTDWLTVLEEEEEEGKESISRRCHHSAD